MNGFAVRGAIGRLQRRAAGGAPMQESPNIFTAVVIRVGTPLKHAENVRPARINGFGHRASNVPNGRATKIGM